MYSTKMFQSKNFRSSSPVFGTFSFFFFDLAILYISRYDPPTILSPTLSYSIPSTTFNPLSHVFSLGMSLSSAQMSIRLLKPSESPGSQLFISSEILSEYTGEDQLSETCAVLISHLGKLKRTGMGWEEKGSFLEFYSKSKSKWYQSYTCSTVLN